MTTSEQFDYKERKKGGQASWFQFIVRVYYVEHHNNSLEGHKHMICNEKQKYFQNDSSVCLKHKLQLLTSSGQGEQKGFVSENSDVCSYSLCV